jgi:hypothetical protein
MNAPLRSRPWWVRLGLWRVQGRHAAWAWCWLSVLLGAICVLLGFWKPVLFLGSVAWLVAFWYWSAIAWVDRYDQW